MSDTGTASSSGSLNGKSTPKRLKALTERREKIVSAFLTKTLKFPHNYKPLGSPKWIKMMQQFLAEPVHQRSSKRDIEGWLNSPRFRDLVDQIRAVYKKYDKIPENERTCPCCPPPSRPWTNILEAVNLTPRRPEVQMESKEESTDYQMETVISDAPLDAKVKEGKAMAETETGSTSSGGLKVKRTPKYKAVLTERKETIISAFLTKTLKLPHKYDSVGSSKWITMLQQLLCEPAHCTSSNSDIEEWLNLPRFSHLVDQICIEYKRHGKVPKSKRTCPCCSSSSRPSSEQQQPWSNILEAVNLVSQQPEGQTKSTEESADVQMEAEAATPAAPVDAEMEEDQIPVFDVDDTSSSGSTAEGYENHQRQIIFQFSNTDELLSYMNGVMMAIVERSRTTADKRKAAVDVRKWEKVYQSLESTKMCLKDGEE